MTPEQIVSLAKRPFCKNTVYLFTEDELHALGNAIVQQAIAEHIAKQQESAPVLPELLELALAQKRYIDALPSDVVDRLPAMPGFDGDWAAEVLERATLAAGGAK